MMDFTKPQLDGFTKPKLDGPDSYGPGGAPPRDKKPAPPKVKAEAPTDLAKRLGGGFSIVGLGFIWCALIISLAWRPSLVPAKFIMDHVHAVGWLLAAVMFLCSAVLPGRIRWLTRLCSPLFFTAAALLYLAVSYKVLAGEGDAAVRLPLALMGLVCLAYGLVLRRSPGFNSLVLYLASLAVMGPVILLSLAEFHHPGMWWFVWLLFGVFALFLATPALALWYMRRQARTTVDIADWSAGYLAAKIPVFMLAGIWVFTAAVGFTFSGRSVSLMKKDLGLNEDPWPEVEER